MDKLKQYLEKMGYKTKDLYELPDSPLLFPDGAHYRNEVAGVETPQVMEAVVAEAERRGVPIHRIIATVGGSTLVTQSDLKEICKMAAAAKYELIITPHCSRGWDSGRQYATAEGLVSGMRNRGMDSVYYVLKDIERCVEAGARGFLVTDEGLLTVLTGLRENGFLPKETIFKVSVFAGHGSPASARLLEQLGANSFKPLADLTLPMLASIRSATSLPLDVYLALVDAMGGFYRFAEAAEIARICAPVYFKFEPGRSEGDIYKTWVEDSYKCYLGKEKVREVQCAMEWAARLNDTLVCSGPGPADLAIPRP
jgi:hypothetical protein